MEKGTIIGMDKTRVYIKTSKKDACNSCHAKHLCLGKKEKIIPVIRKLSHRDLKKGDKISFEISQRQAVMITTIFYGIPIASLLLGLIIGALVTKQDTSIILIILLFILIGFYAQYTLKRKYNFLREIDVIIKKDENIKIYKAKKKAKKTIYKK